MKIRICTPFYCEFESVKNGAKECLEYKDIHFDFEPRQSGPLMFKNRNSLLNDGVSQLKKQIPIIGYDYFLFVDSDISFKLNNVLTLLRHDEKIIASPYLSHNRSGLYNVGQFYEGMPGAIKFHYTKFDVGLKKVDFVGTGFMLIHRTVLETMEYPWFRPSVLDMGDKAEVIGEDVAFCIDAKKNGFDIFCDFDNPVKHNLRTQNDFDWDIYSNRG